MAQQGGNSSGSPTKAAATGGATMKVLVVDDEAIARQIHKAMLGKVGIKDVEVAVNGKAAVDLHLNGASFDLILMDMQMPVMDGPQATKELRAMGVRNTIIGVTSSDGPDKATFINAGLDDCVSKPLAIPQIAKYLKLQGSPTKRLYQRPTPTPTPQ